MNSDAKISPSCFPMYSPSYDFGKKIDPCLMNILRYCFFFFCNFIRCQFKNNTCEFDSSLILSHVGQSLQLPEQSALPDHYIFEWGSGMSNGKNFECGNSSQSVFEYDSCYRVEFL